MACAGIDWQRAGWQNNWQSQSCIHKSQGSGIISKLQTSVSCGDVPAEWRWWRRLGFLAVALDVTLTMMSAPAAMEVAALVLPIWAPGGSALHVAVRDVAAPDVAGFDVAAFSAASSLLELSGCSPGARRCESLLDSETNGGGPRSLSSLIVVIGIGALKTLRPRDPGIS